MKIKITKYLVLAISLLLCCTTALANTNKTFSQNPNVEKFINYMVKKHSFDKKQLTTWFAEAKIQPEVLEKIAKPYEAKPWFLYRNTFVTQKRAKQGVKFWQEHATDLARAEERFGVPAHIIVAILGVESFYGKYQGKYPVLESLATLSFYYPRRAKFFKKELEQFLLLTREQKIDPTKVLGSYAGAMGAPQFMPSSYRHYAVDFTGNGTADLLSSDADVIGSIANYFKVHGWATGQPIAERTSINAKIFKSPKSKNVKPKLTPAQLTQYGIQPSENLPKDKLASFIILDGKDQPEYWLGFQNFYVITRYNTSKLYAMAVYELAEKIKQNARHAEQKARVNT